MDFYLTTSASAFPCFQINWIMKKRKGCRKFSAPGSTVPERKNFSTSGAMSLNDVILCTF